MTWKKKIKSTIGQAYLKPIFAEWKPHICKSILIYASARLQFFVCGEMDTDKEKQFLLFFSCYWDGSECRRLKSIASWKNVFYWKLYSVFFFKSKNRISVHKLDPWTLSSFNESDSAASVSQYWILCPHWSFRVHSKF